jgi:hypothetical protein
VAATTVAHQENAMRSPSGLWRPNRRSRKKPATVGGSTRGRMKIPSRKPRHLPRYRLIAHAAAMPSTKVNAVADIDVLTDIQRGLME